MALQKQITLPNGSTAEYHKVIVDEFNNDNITFHVDIYVDKEKREAGYDAYPMKFQTADVCQNEEPSRDIRTFTDLEIIAMVYRYLKTTEKYTNSIDC